MKPLLRSWTLILVAAILFVGGMIWVRLHPRSTDLDDPLLQARKAVAESFGVEAATSISASGGVLVEAVIPGSAAEQLGIQAGDRIVACGDRSVWHVYQLDELASSQLARGSAVGLMLEREGTYWVVVLGSHRHSGMGGGRPRQQGAPAPRDS
jgi:predicted metalloprotease with PDZ domain